MKLRRTAEGLIARHESGHWIRLEGDGLTTEICYDMFSLLE
jgi:hypothetical protein